MKLIEAIRKKRAQRAQDATSGWWAAVDKYAALAKVGQRDVDEVEQLLDETGRSLEQFERDVALVQAVADAERAAAKVETDETFDSRAKEIADRTAELDGERAAFDERQREARQQLDADLAAIVAERNAAKHARARLAAVRAALEEARDPQPPRRVLRWSTVLDDGTRFAELGQRVVQLDGTIAEERKARCDPSRIRHWEAELARALDAVRAVRGDYDELEPPTDPVHRAAFDRHGLT